MRRWASWAWVFVGWLGWPWAISHMWCRVSGSTSAAPGGRHWWQAAPPTAGWKAWWGPGLWHWAQSKRLGAQPHVGHGLEEEGVEKHERIAVLELVEDVDAGIVEVGVPGGIGGGEALGGFEGGAGGGVALIILDDARTEVVHGIGLGNGVEVSAWVELHVEVDEELQARAEARFGAANALGHPAHEAVVASQEHDDAIRLAKIIGTDDEGAVAEIFAHFRSPGGPVPSGPIASS